MNKLLLDMILLLSSCWAAGGLGVQKTCLHLLVEVGIYINQRFDDAMCDQTNSSEW